MSVHSSKVARLVVGFLALVAARGEALAGALAGNNGIYQTGVVDHTATRLDSEVFGWSTDFSQVAALVTNTRRNSRGGARGEVLLVVFPTNDIKPLDNVEINIITAAELPHAPVMVGEAFDDGRSQLGDIDYNLARMWPQRPKKSRPNGWMKVETLWDPVQINATDCQPAVAFVLEAGNQVRFQPHQVVPDIRANCRALRMSNVRTYWARPDLAVAMARFDWSPDNHEISFRQPVSAKWQRARELRILVRSADTKDNRTERVVKALSGYGRVRVESAGRGVKSGIAAAADVKLLEERFANTFSIPRSPAPLQGGADLVVTLGDDDPERPVGRYGSQRLSKR